MERHHTSLVEIANRCRAAGLLAIILLGLTWIPALGASEPWTLERAVQTALTNNPDARLAQHRIAAARAGQLQADSALWPLVQLNTSYGITDNPTRVFGAALNQRSFDFGLIEDVPDVDTFNAHGLVVMPLYRGGQVRAARRESAARVQAARSADLAVRQALAFEVARTFFTLQKTRAFIQATESAVEAFEANLVVAGKRQAAGTALKNEVLDVEVRLAEARENLVRSRNADALARQALGTLLAVEEPVTDLELATPDIAAPPPSTPVARSELQAAEQQRRAAEAALERAKGGRMPAVNAYGRYDYDHGWRFNSGGGSYTAGVELQWNLWDGQLTRGRVQEAQAAIDTALEQERKLRLAIDLEIAQARLYVQEAEQRLEVTSRVIAQAEESADLTRARFEQGLALSTQMIDAENALTAARFRRAEAEAGRRVAVSALRRALGLPQLAELELTP
jgi:outer membrane protein